MPDDNEAVNLEVSISGNTTSKSGENEMADLSENVVQILMKTGSEAYQHSMTRGIEASQLANGVLQVGAARRQNELDIGESRAQSGLIATPIASPTAKAP